MDKIYINVEIKYWVLILTIVSISVSLGIYLTATKTPDVMVGLGIVGANIALATLIYTAMNLHTVINHNQAAIYSNQNQHEEMIELEKKRHSSEIISKWQTPEMVKIVTKGYEIRNTVNKMEAKEIAEYLKNNEEHHQALVCIFNYFEKMAHLVEYEVVNENMLKDYFKDLVNIYFHCFSGFIEYKQREMKSTDVMKSFIRLAGDWQKN